MKELFIEKKFSASSLVVIETVNQILAEYSAQGYDLSLRQLYYQLVTRGHIENSIQHGSGGARKDTLPALPGAGAGNRTNYSAVRICGVDKISVSG